jgi:hypothetical protein
LHFGAPLEDLFNFAAAAAYRRIPGQPTREAKALITAFYGTSALAVRTKKATQRLLQRLHMDESLLEPLFGTFLLSRLVKTEFSNSETWREFIRLYMEAGAPPLFGRAAALATKAVALGRPVTTAI